MLIELTEAQAQYLRVVLDEERDRNEDHLAFLKSAADDEEDKPQQLAECETALTQVATILPKLAETSPPALAHLTPDQLADRFFLTDLVATPAYLQLRQQVIQEGRYQPDQDGEWPDGYWDDLNAAVEHLLRRALELNEPVKA